MTNFQQQFQAKLNKQLLINEPLGKYTTIGIGGPAEYFFTATSSQEMIDVISLAQQHNIPVRIIGGGSNIIISDQGIKGLVIRSQILDFEIIDNVVAIHELPTEKTKPRLGQIKDLAKYKKDGLQQSFDENSESVYIKVGSGWKMNSLIQKCLQQGLTGIEWFGGIPGSLGGGIYMNMHGGDWFWSDFVVNLECIDIESAKTFSRQHESLKFDYDYSILHETHDIILVATLKLYKGDTEKAKKTFSYWAAQKTINQPQNSAGCMYQNLDVKTQNFASLPTPSIGYLIDHELGLKGHQIGGAKISEKHCAFIENSGGATAADVKALVQLVQTKAKEKFDIDIQTEVEFIGE